MSQVGATRDRVANSIGSSYRDLEPELCSNELFDDNSVWFKYENTAILCPKHNDYTLQGAYSSNELKFLNISVVKCSPLLGHENCATSQEIDIKLSTGRIVVVLQNSYVDFEDYENVIKTYVDDRFSYRVSPGFLKEAQIYVRNNHVSLSDNIVQIGEGEQRQFYSVESSSDDFVPLNSLIYFSAYIRMESREDTYERVVFSFFDLTGLVGGVFEILEVTGGIFVSFFAHKLFMFSMLSDLYQVQKIDPDHEFSKIIPKTEVFKTKTKRSKRVPKLYEEAKTPKKKKKAHKKLNFKSNVSNMNEKHQIQNN